jgi:hypothetical protein
VGKGQFNAATKVAVMVAAGALKNFIIAKASASYDYIVVYLRDALPFALNDVDWRIRAVISVSACLALIACFITARLKGPRRKQ